MKYISLISAVAIIALAAPALAEDDSAAEIFDRAHASGESSPAAYDTALAILSGDRLDDRITPEHHADVATRNFSVGHLQLANEMGVPANAYTTAELAKMFIDAYD